ncbi:hypothetical protein [Pseudomonas sp. L1(2025)]|uniref:hypothetical protein n=1 Tax=Pseudomonas sp. L1(2025) TaxID=3449429 RepID=UPI003F68F55B
MSTVLPLPDDDRLDAPFSAFRPVDLTDKVRAPYPEESPEGLGADALLPQWMVVVNDWPEQTIGDSKYLYFGEPGIQVARGIVENNEPFEYFFITADKYQDGDIKYYVRVERLGSGQSSKSDTKKILLKRTLPGGEDERPAEPWHSGLFMWVEGLADGDIIDTDVAEAGFYCVINPYLYMRFNDQCDIRLAAGVVVKHTVSPEEAKSLKPIKIFVDSQTIAKLPKSTKLLFDFTVRDVVGNKPGGKYQYSRAVNVISETDPKLAAAPSVLLDKVPLDQIDLDAVTQEALLRVRVILKAEKKAPQPPHKVEIKLEVALGDSVKIISLPTILDTNQQLEETNLPKELINDLSGGRVRVWFEVKTNAGVFKYMSGSKTLTVVGEPTLMDAPTLSPIQAGLISSGMAVEMKIPFYFPFDEDATEIKMLQLINAEGGGIVVSSTQAAGVQGGSRTFSAEAVKVFDGKGPARAFYTSQRDQDIVARQSKVTPFEIGNRVPVLPKMYLADAVDGNIDPDAVLGDETIAKIRVFDSVVGQEIHWTAEGKDPRSSTGGVIKVTKALAGEKLAELEIPVDLQVLRLNINRVMRFSYTRVTPGSPKKIERSESYDVTVGPPIVLESFNILEITSTDGFAYPREFINGATLRAKGTFIKGMEAEFKWQGQYRVSTFKTTVKLDPKTNTFTANVPVGVIIDGIRPEPNEIVVTCSIRHYGLTFNFPPLVFKLRPLRLPPTPRIRGYENSSVLPVHQVAGPLRFDVAAFDFMRVGQKYWATASGVYADEEEYNEPLFTANEVIESDLKGISALFPTDKLPLLKDGSILTIEFWLSFPGIPLLWTAQKFGVAQYIIEQLPPVLPYPVLNAALTTEQETKANPITVQSKPGVIIKVPGLVATDSITLFVNCQNSKIYELSSAGHSSGSVMINLTDEIVADMVNSRVLLQFALNRKGVTTLSKVQTIQVDTISSNHLPRPTINNVPEGGALDLNTFTTDALISVPKWILSKAGQIVSVDLIGNGSVFPVLENYEINQAQAEKGLGPLTVSRTLLENIWPSGRRGEIRVMVSYDGTADKTRAVVFPVSTFTILLLRRALETFESGPIQAIPLQTTLKFPGLRVTSRSHGVSLINGGNYWAPSSTGLNVYLAPRAIVSLTLTVDAVRVIFGIADSSRIQSQVGFYDRDGNLMAQFATPAYGAAGTAWVDYTAPSGRRIGVINIWDGGGDSFVDNVYMYY